MKEPLGRAGPTPTIFKYNAIVRTQLNSLNNLVRMGVVGGNEEGRNLEPRWKRYEKTRLEYEAGMRDMAAGDKGRVKIELPASPLLRWTSVPLASSQHLPVTSKCHEEPPREDISSL